MKKKESFFTSDLKTIESHTIKNKLNGDFQVKGPQTSWMN